VRIQVRHQTPVNVVFASGSMVRLFACSQTICTVCKWFANKDGCATMCVNKKNSPMLPPVNPAFIG